VTPEATPSIALFPWGDVIEEFLEPIGLTPTDFAEKMSGGWLFGYASALQRAGMRPVIVYGSEGCDVPTCLTHAATGTRIWLVPAHRVSERGSPAVRSIRRWRAMPSSGFETVLRQEQCRALIVQEYEYTRFDRLTRLGRRLGLPTFASFQGGDRNLSWVESIVRPSSLAASAGLIIASAAERARVRERYGANLPPIVDTPNPLDVAAWQPMERAEARASLGLPAEGFILINHGRIDIRRKGLDVLLAAWARNDSGELVIIGSGQDHAAFEALLGETGARNVRWIGEYTTDRDFMRRWLSAADAYISASRIEGMPVAPLEAMACGLPVVATDAQGIPDIFCDGEASGALLVRRDDSAMLAEAINRLRRSPLLRATLGQAAHKRVANRFSLDAVGSELAALIGTAGKRALGAETSALR
jgi:glycosyltransferase involved in cell wall biosynthesis